MSEAELKQEDETIPFYPDHVLTEFRVTVVVMIVIFVIGILGLISPVGLGEPADPMNTPLHVKPEWYFLALYQLLKYIPSQIVLFGVNLVEGEVLGVVLPVIAVGLLTIWPFLDRKPDQSKKIYRTRAIVVAVAMIILIALTILGEVS